jgi:hypothetical protein
VIASMMISQDSCSDHHDCQRETAMARARRHRRQEHHIFRRRIVRHVASGDSGLIPFAGRWARLTHECSHAVALL